MKGDLASGDGHGGLLTIRPGAVHTHVHAGPLLPQRDDGNRCPQGAPRPCPPAAAPADTPCHPSLRPHVCCPRSLYPSLEGCPPPLDCLSSPPSPAPCTGVPSSGCTSPPAPATLTTTWRCRRACPWALPSPGRAEGGVLSCTVNTRAGGGTSGPKPLRACVRTHGALLARGRAVEGCADWPFPTPF